MFFWILSSYKVILDYVFFLNLEKGYFFFGSKERRPYRSSRRFGLTFTVRGMQAGKAGSPPRPLPLLDACCTEGNSYILWLLREVLGWALMSVTRHWYGLLRLIKYTVVSKPKAPYPKSEAHDAF